MRRIEKKITDKQIIEEILQYADICRIAIMDGSLPYIVPLNYGYKNGILYFHSAKDGRKIELLKKNNRVCFEVEDDFEILKDKKACKWGLKYRSVIGYGTVEFLENKDEKISGLDVLMGKYGSTNNFYDDETLEKVYVLKLTIETMTGKQSGNWD